MSRDFNPYSEWFKIPLDQQPPHHYQLLGLDPFESDLDLIDQASERRLIFLQDVANGPYTKQSQKLLNEVATARLCLLDKDRKAAYDYGLQHPESLKQNHPPRNHASSSAPNSADESLLDDIFQSSSGQRPARKAKTTKGKKRPEQRPAIRTNNPRPTVQISTSAYTSAPLDQEADKKKQLIIIGVLAVSVLVPLAIIGIWWLALGQRANQTDERDGLQQANENTTTEEDRQSSGNPIRKSGLVSSTSESGDDTATSDANEKKQKQVAPKKDKGELKQKKQPSKKSTSQTNSKVTPASNRLADAKGIPSKGLEIWLSAAEKTSLKLENSRVARWSDLSGNGRDAVQQVAKARGEWNASAINKRPGVVLNAKEKNSFEFVDSLDLQLGDDYSIVLVGICQTGILLSKGDSTGEPPTQGFAMMNSATRLHFGKDADFSAHESDREKSQLRTRILIAHQDHLEWFVDGQLAGTSTIAHKISEAKPLMMGTREKSPRYAEAIVCEFMLYNRDLNADERQAVEQFLVARWIN